MVDRLFLGHRPRAEAAVRDACGQLRRGHSDGISSICRLTSSAHVVPAYFSTIVLASSLASSARPIRMSDLTTIAARSAASALSGNRSYIPSRASRSDSSDRTGASPEAAPSARAHPEAADPAPPSRLGRQPPVLADMARCRASSTVVFAAVTKCAGGAGSTRPLRAARSPPFARAFRTARRRRQGLPVGLRQGGWLFAWP